jgi:hypothetical protein
MKHGWRGLTTVKRSGGEQHNKRSGVEDTTQGDWVADGTTRERGADNAAALVVDSFWRRREGGRGALKTSSKSYLKIVPQIAQNPPRKIGFSEVFFAQFDVQFDVR